MYDVEEGRWERDIHLRPIEIAEATMPIEHATHAGLRWDAGELLDVDDVTRPLLEGKSIPLKAVEITF